MRADIRADTHIQRRHIPPYQQRCFFSRSLSTLLLCFLFACSLFLPLACLGSMVRIPIQRRTIAPGEHYRDVHSLIAHAARDFEGPMPTMHEARAMYTDPARIIQLKNFYNRMYTGAVQVGTPAVSYDLVFDTGSADMWLFAAASLKPILDYVTYYDYSQSSTSRVSTTSWSIQYGKGASKGNLVSDRVQLSDRSASGFTFAQATSYSEDFESPAMPLDGLLGLAFQQVNSAGTPTLIDALKSAGQITERVFSFYLTTDNPEGSEFILGMPDLAMTRGNLTFFDLASSTGMWLLSMQAVMIGSTTSFCTSGCAVLLDTGTSFIGMPVAAFNSFATRVNAARSDCLIDSGSGLIRCSRNTADGLPSMSFSIQGSLFTVEGSDYFEDGILGFMSIDISTSSGSSFWILGDTFLKTYYTVYDMDNRKIGIANAKPGVPYTASTSSSKWGSDSWRLFVLVFGVALGSLLLLMACFFFYRMRSVSRSDSPRSSRAPPPYLLHQPPPPPFQSQPYAGQPTQLYPGQAATMPQQPQSEFARDFYRTAQV